MVSCLFVSPLGDNKPDRACEIQDQYPRLVLLIFGTMRLKTNTTALGWGRKEGMDIISQRGLPEGTGFRLVMCWLPGPAFARPHLAWPALVDHLHQVRHRGPVGFSSYCGLSFGVHKFLGSSSFFE